MKTQLILLDTPIIVSDEEIKKGDWYFDLVERKSFQRTWDKWDNNMQSEGKKIIVGLPELPSIDFNGFEEKLGLIDVEELAEKAYFIAHLNLESVQFKHGFIDGFKYAQSLNEKKFSEEDIREALEEFIKDVSCIDGKLKAKTPAEAFFWIKIYIESLSLSQTKVFDIEIEMEESDEYISKVFNGDIIPNGSWKMIPKITNNQIKIIKML